VTEGLAEMYVDIDNASTEFERYPTSGTLDPSSVRCCLLSSMLVFSIQAS